MRKDNLTKTERKPFKSFEMEYSKTHQAIILRILDTDGMYPFYLQDPDAGTYRIKKTSAGKLQMEK